MRAPRTSETGAALFRVLSVARAIVGLLLLVAFLRLMISIEVRSGHAILPMKHT